MAQVLGIQKSPGKTLETVRALKRAGYADLEVYSPVPNDDLEEELDRGPSKVRIYTLLGCLTGVTVAYTMQIWMAYNWPLVIGGKPFASIPAYTIVGFELNILFGGLATVAGMFLHGLFFTRKGHAAYQPSFSGDEFGCVVDCNTDQVPAVQDVLRGAGCVEVRVVSS